MVDISVDVTSNGTTLAEENGGGADSGALRGLRLLTMDRGSDGFGFHMYTNRELKVLRARAGCPLEPLVYQPLPAIYTC